MTEEIGPKLAGVMAKANCQSIGRGVRPSVADFAKIASEVYGARRRAKRPLSPRRAAEFRGRYLRKIFGTRKQRTHRWQFLVREYGILRALALSRSRLELRAHYYGVPIDCARAYPRLSASQNTQAAEELRDDPNEWGKINP